MRTDEIGSAPAREQQGTGGGIDGETFDLAARYAVEDGQVLLTGVQSIVRLLIDQLRADRRRGLRTAAFVSGYPGSPLGGFDLALERADTSGVDIRHVPGLNEDLAATAVWGSQQDHLAPLSGLDGVLGLWYGKAPGLDRSGDVLRHANLHGSGTNGGVVVAVGDDPASKSSTLPGASEMALCDFGMPIFTPGTVEEALLLGRHAFEMSRFTGLWSGFKVTTALADGFGTAYVSPTQPDVKIPTVSFDGLPWRHTQVARFFLPTTVELERQLHEERLPAAQAYLEANDVNRLTLNGADDRIGFVASGRTYHELRQAFADLGLDDSALSRAGIRLLQLGVVYPIDPATVHAFAHGLTDIVVVEEKRSFIEAQLRDFLYGRTGAPRIQGKFDTHGRRLVPVDSDLSADRIADALAPILSSLANVELRSPVTSSSGESIRLLPTKPAGTADRTAYFCSGCPHNRSTVDVSGSPVGGGVGCHGLVMTMDRGATSYTQMGGEGAQWIGRAPFVDAPHFVQNIGDGTFFHSGSLSVRFAVAAGVNTTFKLLYNGVVAMTGGQNPAGQLPVPEVCRLLLAENVQRVLVVAEDVSRYRKGSLPPGVDLWPRDRLDEAEVVLAGTPGVTVLVYDQACANELRRMRKRNLAPTKNMRVLINEAVCEGCGDCGVKSNCLSVQPVDTPYGRKTQIHQGSCNTDYTCLDGNCPSFVTVEVPEASTGGGTGLVLEADIPDPVDVPSVDIDGFSLFIAGIGGTGIVTLNQILATAATFDGYTITGLDQTGLAQKGGPVVSHLKIWQGATDRSGAVGEAGADAFLALDVLSATDPKNLSRADPDRTRMLASSSQVATGTMVIDTAQQFGDVDRLLEVLRGRSRPDHFEVLDVVGASEALFHDHMSANLIALGAAYQMGALPIREDSIRRAITINGVMVERSLQAFRAGRLAVSDPSLFARYADRRRAGSLPTLSKRSDLAEGRRLCQEAGVPSDVSEVASQRAAELVAYQNRGLAREYLRVVRRVSDAERSLAPQRTTLTEAVIQNLFKLMAYKDEYEVARLHLDFSFDEALLEALPGGSQIRYRLRPPSLQSLGMKQKIAVPSALAKPAFKLLRSMRRLRGTRFDVFGGDEIRRLERELVVEYVHALDEALVHLDEASYPEVTALAGLPDLVRGYDEVKRANVQVYRTELMLLRSAIVGSDLPVVATD